MLDSVNQIDTEVRFDDQVIYTKFTGSISKADICSVIREWSYLLQQHSSITCAVFDFSSAFFVGRSKESLLDIAIRTKLLSSIRRYLRVIGICPSEPEYLLAKQWSTYAISMHSIDYGQVDLYRCTSEAHDHIHEVTRTKPQATNRHCNQIAAL